MSSKRQRLNGVRRVTALIALVLMGSGCEDLFFETPEFNNPYDPINKDTTPEVTWTEVVGDVPGLFPRTDFATAVFDGKIWIVSGVDDEGNFLDDVWSSPDGETWTQEHSGDSFLTNTNPGFISFDGQLFYFNPQTGEIYHSSDGSDWVSPGEPPGIGAQHVRLSSSGESILAVSAESGEVWVSSTPTDMGTWTQLDDGSSFSGGDPEDLAFASHEEYGWVVARGFGEPDELWRGRPGEGWEKMGSSGDYNRDWTQLVSFGGYLWMLGGWHEPTSTITNDVVRIDTSTIDHSTQTAPWSSRQRFGAIVFNDRIYVFGGVGNDNDFRTDVWVGS